MPLFLIEVAPAVVALVGLLVLWAKPAGAIGKIRPASVLLWWCVLSLGSEQATFMMTARLGWSATAISGIVLACAVAAFVLLLVPGRSRAVLSWLTVTLSTALILVDRLYLAWFGDMFPAVAWLSAHQAATVAGIAVEWVTGHDLWSAIQILLVSPLVIAAWRSDGRPDHRWRPYTLAATAIVAGAAGWHTFTAIRAEPAIVTQRFSNLALVEKIGPLAFHGLDSWLLVRRSLASELVSHADFEEVLEWLKERAPLRAGTGPLFGVATGKNLIVIQVESLQEPMVNLRINGRDVMPNLRKLAAEHLYFSNVVDQTDEGRTSDAEWMMLTSQYPEAHGAAAFANQANHLVGLPSVLAGRGYQSLSAVPFTPGFWNRRVMHQNLGFFHSYFADDFSPAEPIGWGLNDRDFLRQMTPRLAATPQPFLAWLISLSLHHPFAEFPSAHKQLDVTPWADHPFGNYLHAMHYFDSALGEFLDSLSSGGLLDRSVLVVTGDHSAGFPWQSELAHALGFSNSLAHWTLAERVPMVIRVPGAAPQEISCAVGHVDFAPTVLGLLGFDASGLPYVGRNSLGSPGEEPVIRRKGSWVSPSHLFLLRGRNHGAHCYDRRTLLDVPLAECEAESAIALRKALLGRRISQQDLQQRLSARLTADPP